MFELEKRILAVLAHPDDESFGMGGTLAKYASEGAKVQLICATRGEAGDVDPDWLEGYQTIADLRVAELNCAARALGLDQVHLLAYRDSGMSGSKENQHPRALINAPLESVVREIVDTIRTFKPQVVLTFDPIGGYRHPDHIYIHRAATRAFSLAADPEYRSDSPPHQASYLYYHTIPRYFIRFNIRLLKLLGRDPSRYGKNQDIDLTKMAGEDFPTHVRINYSAVKDRKINASICHASQGGQGLTRGPMRWIAWLVGARPVDQFMQAHPPPPAGKVKPASDLFAGLK